MVSTIPSYRLHSHAWNDGTSNFDEQSSALLELDSTWIKTLCFQHGLPYGITANTQKSRLWKGVQSQLLFLQPSYTSNLVSILGLSMIQPATRCQRAWSIVTLLYAHTQLLHLLSVYNALPTSPNFSLRLTGHDYNQPRMFTSPAHQCYNRSSMYIWLHWCSPKRKTFHMHKPPDPQFQLWATIDLSAKLERRPKREPRVCESVPTIQNRL